MLNEATFIYEMFIRMLPGIPLTLQLAATSIACGGCLGLVLALMRTSGWALLDAFARAYIALFRGTPLLVQIYLIYYGLSQYPELRSSVLWPLLRQPWWCAGDVTEYGSVRRGDYSRLNYHRAKRAG